MEDLENKILGGDFDEYTLDRYKEAIREEQRKVDYEKAEKVYRKELSDIMNIFNKLGKMLHLSTELGMVVKFEESVSDFRKALEK